MPIIAIPADLSIGWISRAIMKKRRRLNSYYVCYIREDEIVLDNKPKWIYFYADSHKYMKYRQDAVDQVRTLFPNRPINTTTITLQKLLESDGLTGENIDTPIRHYQVDSYFLTLCNFRNFKKRLISKRFKQINNATPKKYVF